MPSSPLPNVPNNVMRAAVKAYCITERPWPRAHRIAWARTNLKHAADPLAAKFWKLALQTYGAKA